MRCETPISFAFTLPIERSPEKEDAAAYIQRLLEMHRANTGEAVPRTVTNRHVFRPKTSLSRPNIGHATNANSLHTNSTKEYHTFLHPCNTRTRRCQRTRAHALLCRGATFLHAAFGGASRLTLISGNKCLEKTGCYLREVVHVLCY